MVEWNKEGWARMVEMLLVCGGVQQSLAVVLSVVCQAKNTGEWNNEEARVRIRRFMLRW